MYIRLIIVNIITTKNINTTFMKKIATVNNKGGIGKTTSVQNIGADLAQRGYRVLLIDLDPQTNLTESFACFTDGPNMYHSFSKNAPLNVINIKKNLSLVPSSLELQGIELEISNRIRREDILNRLIKPLEDQFDYCIMDCPPALGLLTVNALVAADSVIIPMEAEYLAYRGLETIKDMVDNIKEEINPALKIGGVFFTKLKPNLSLTKAIKEEVKKTFGATLCDNSIRVNVALSECQSNGQDIFSYAPESNGAKDYKNLVKELLKRVN